MSDRHISDDGEDTERRNRSVLTMADLTITIPSQDLGDFYRMLRDFRRNRGNTFAYLQIELEQRYPKLKERYGTAFED